ncbi:MAG: hypothetical protein KAQ98_00175 [Bacteriovoracaceae bacterium]|nr:hypothetical protein [Bacteriovoracaceae bacterium]
MTNLYKTSHYKESRVIYPKDEDNIAEQTYQSFKLGINKTLQYFNLNIKLPLFNIFIVPNRKEYDSFVAHLTSIPTSKGRVGQPQLVDLYLLSPLAYKTDADEFYINKDGSYNEQIYKRLVIHESVHMIEELISPKDSMEVRPLWWSEGLAVLISEQYRLDSDIIEYMRKDLFNKQLPRIQMLEGVSSYTWGWSLVKFCIDNFGIDKIIKIMKETCDKDIIQYLNITESELEKKWHESILKTSKEIT